MERSAAQLLRIFLGDRDHLGHQSLSQAIIEAARDQELAGATVLHGVLGYGASARIHTVRTPELAVDLPLIIEIIDTEAKIQAFLPAVQRALEQAGGGGLITLEKVEVFP